MPDPTFARRVLGIDLLCLQEAKSQDEARSICSTQLQDNRKILWSVLEDLSVPRGWVSGVGAGPAPCAAFGGGDVVDIYCFSEE